MAKISLAVVGIAILLVLVIAVPMFGLPHYGVWRAGLSGEALLRKAEQEKKIAIETAKAKVEAAKLEAQAELERAKGMAQAIEAVGEMSAKYPDYKHQRFIEGFAQALEDGKVQQIIYVPTESNIPIVESRNRRNPLPE